MAHNWFRVFIWQNLFSVDVCGSDNGPIVDSGDQFVDCFYSRCPTGSDCVKVENPFMKYAVCCPDSSLVQTGWYIVRFVFLHEEHRVGCNTWEKNVTACLFQNVPSNLDFFFVRSCACLNPTVLSIRLGFLSCQTVDVNVPEVGISFL